MGLLFCYHGLVARRNKTMDERIKTLKDEVKKGSISAAFSLAEAFKWGYYGASDPQRAARMYRICCRSKEKKTAALGFYNWGVLYYYGYLNDQGESESRQAFDCFLKSLMLHPTPQAFSRLGDMYRYGQYVEKNETVALSLYVKAGV